MEDIKEILGIFEGLILAYKIDREEQDSEGFYFKLTVRLKDNSRLAVEERLNHLGYMYSYHWMQENNTLIIRWDNAPNHLKIGRNHKHIGTTENVHASEEMNLKKVLQYIAQIIGVLLLLTWFFW